MKNRIIDSAVYLPVVKGKLTLDPWLREAGPWKIARAIVAPSGKMVPPQTIFNWIDLIGRYGRICKNYLQGGLCENS